MTTKDKRMRVAIYARVSTKDGRQTVKSQVLSLREYCDRMNWRVAEVYTDDHPSAVKVDDLPGLKRMFDDAARGKFERLVVFALDRFSRDGVEETFKRIARLNESGVDFWSQTEELFRAGEFGKVMIALNAFSANFERQRLIDRVNMGLARARKEGKQLGRRKKRVTFVDIEKLQNEGLPMPEICQRLGVGRSTIYARLQKAS